MADYFGQVYVKETEDALSIGNDALERGVSIRDNVARTVYLANKLDGKEEFFESVEFELGLEDDKKLTTLDFTYVKHWVEGLDGRGKRLTIRLKKEGLSLDLVYELFEDDFFMRKYLVIGMTNNAACTINHIDVERLGGEAFLWRRDILTPEGLGQPIFIGNMFFGLEYPGAENTFPPIRLRHYPGAEITSRLQSKKAVFGVAPKGKVADWFLYRYLPRIRIRPARPFVIYNAWHHGLNLNARMLIDDVEFLKKTFYEKHNLSLDSFALDHGWFDYTSIWGIDRRKFPEGFQTLIRKLTELQTHLGLWISLPGYVLNTFWGKKRGLEVIKEEELSGCYCIAGPRYRAELKEALGYYVKEMKVNYFKCDYNHFDCQNPDHGHPIGRAAKDAIIDAYIDVLEFLNACNPNIFLAMTSGAFLSPWWLMYVDSLWLGGSDWDKLSELRSPYPRDQAESYRDKIMHDDYVKKKYQFPASALMTHGIVKAKEDILGEGEPLQKFYDHVMLTLCRGISKWEMLIVPQMLTDSEWNFLAEAFKWAKRNWNILSKTKMFGGDPEKGETYGYAHFQGETGIICLRNPAVETKRAEVQLDEGLGLEEGETKKSYSVKVIYPYEMSLEETYHYGKRVEFEVKGCQVITAYIGPHASIQKWVGLHQKDQSTSQKDAGKNLL